MFSERFKPIGVSATLIRTLAFPPYCFSDCRDQTLWEDNIKMDLQEVGGGRGDWMELSEDKDRWRALVGTMRDFRVP